MSLHKKYNKYKIPSNITNKSFKELCKPPDKFTYQMPQLFVSNYIHPTTSNKGLLIFHKIGSGKTCSAISICENFLKKNRNSKDKYKVVIVLPASLIGNFLDELKGPCGRYHYSNIISDYSEDINKAYSIYSYHKFTKLLLDNQISLHNTLLVIDEVQNIVSETGSFYNIIYNAIYSKPLKNFRIVIMSGTPIFDKPVEIGLTMNLLPLPQKFDIKSFNDKFIQIEDENTYSMKNKEEFASYIRGFVSYYRGMPAKSFPKYEVFLVKCEMESYQYKCYKTILKQENISTKKSDDIFNLPNNFFIGSRTISNIAYPNQKSGQEGYNLLTNKHIQKYGIKQYSIKFHKLIKKINRCSGKIFIYSNFLEYGGLKPLQKLLQYYGYVPYSKRDEKKPKRNRCYYAIWSGQKTLEEKTDIKHHFNDKTSNLRIMLGTPAIKEGVTLLRVSQVHILEPYWNNSRILQVMGRAIRYCSHKDLPSSERKVEVYIYIATRPNEKSLNRLENENMLNKYSVDKYIFYLSQSKLKLTTEFENVLKYYQKMIFLLLHYKLIVILHKLKVLKHLLIV